VTKTILLFMALLAMVLPSSAATKRKATKHRSHPISPSSTSRKAPKYKAPKYKGQKYKAPKSHRRSYQQAPTPERYKDIQQALVSKGYFHGEPNGEWGPDSADALKHFQAEQNLTPDGKLTSLSLIALGLGPKRLTATRSQPSAADATKPEVPK
jgi:peptidoglycan hydrolase-like protein with peptidoglycan-binding domain